MDTPEAPQLSPHRLWAPPAAVPRAALPTPQVRRLDSLLTILYDACA
jgi:hypothetical protein